MTKISRILKDYRHSGALSALVGPHAWVAEGVFLTKAGDLGCVLHLAGIDYECLDHAARAQAVRRFEAALRVFDDQFRIYQYFAKRRCRTLPHQAAGVAFIDAISSRRLAQLSAEDSDLYEVDTHAVVLHHGWYVRQSWRQQVRRLLSAPTAALRDVLSPIRVLYVMDAALQRAVTILCQKVDTFVVQTQGNIQARLLNTVDAFAFLRGLLNYNADTAASTHQTGASYLDFALTDSDLECHRGYLRLGDMYLHVLTLKDPPPQTYAHLLEPLYDAPAPVLVATEWRVDTPTHMRRAIQSKRRHFHNAKSSLLNYLSPAPPAPGEILIDDAAAAMVDDLGGSLKEMELHGRRFGAFSLTAVCFDDDRAALDRHVRTVQKAFASRHLHLVEERYNLLNAWLSTIPGNHAHNLRRMYLLDTNYADLSFVFSLREGERTNRHLGQEYLTVLETHHTPYFLNLHVDDVAHSLVLGSTGSGKSFFVSFLLGHLQKYRPRTVIFDLGGSYRRLVERLGGGYLAIGLDCRAVTINPFALPPTREHLHFLFMFVKVLIESGGQYAMTLHDDRDLYEQIENLYAIDPHNRRLFTLRNILNRTLADYLTPWVQGGPYASLFDYAEDTLTCADCQCFDFEGLERYPQLLEPLLFYVLHRASDAVHDPMLADTLKVFALDEAWRFLKNRTIKEYVAAALKTWRKRNALLLMATQSSDDLAASALLRTAIESCPSTFFLANPGLDRTTYRDLFSLNDLELDRIATLVPRQDILLKRADFAKVLTLRVDSESAALFATSPRAQLA